VLTTEDLLRLFAEDLVRSARAEGHEGVEAIASALPGTELQHAVRAVQRRQGGLAPLSPAVDADSAAFVKSQQAPKPAGHSPLSMRIEAKKGEH
jgi:hypothetical protein